MDPFLFVTSENYLGFVPMVDVSGSELVNEYRARDFREISPDVLCAVFISNSDLCFIRNLYLFRCDNVNVFRIEEMLQDKYGKDKAYSILMRARHEFHMMTKE